MKPTRVPLLLTAALVVLTSACATTPPAGVGATGTPSPTASSPGGTTLAGDLSGTRWLLAELNGAPTLEGTSVTAEFTSDGMVGGSAGCNRYRAAVTAAEGVIEVGEAVAMTRMACEEPVMAQEAAFLTALGSARRFTVGDGRLTLEGDGGTRVAAFTAQRQELADTNWEVAAYNDGRSAVVSVLEGTTPSVAFGGDGTVAGSGGCNRFTGGFTLDDGAIHIGPLASTAMSCEDPAGVMDQEAALLMALESAATFVLEGDTLTLRDAADAIALQLRRV